MIIQYVCPVSDTGFTGRDDEVTHGYAEPGFLIGGESFTLT